MGLYVKKPDGSYIEHVITSPIDHLDFSITTNKFDSSPHYKTFCYLALLPGTYVYHFENPNLDHTYTLLSIRLADYTYVTIMRNGMRMPIRVQSGYWNCTYTHEMVVSASTGDHSFTKWIVGTGTLLGYEAVDLSDYHYLYGLSASGSTFKCYRAWENMKDISSATPKFTVTDTQYAFGHIGIGHVRGTDQHYALMTFFMLPMSQSVEAIAVVEYPMVGSGKPEDPFRPDMPEELVEISQADVTPDEWLAVQSNPKGPNGLPLVNRLAVTWGAVDFRNDQATGNPIASSFLAAVYGGSPSYVRRDNVLRHIEHARKKGLKVYTPPFDLSKVREIHVREKRDRDWLIEPEELAYQILGREDLEIDAVAKFYERELSLGRVNPNEIADFDFTMDLWSERAEKFKKDDIAKKFRGFKKR